MFRDDLESFIVQQLNEMARNVSAKSKVNIAKRGYNPFSLFEGNEEKYMAIGRSFDSQLGTRLQKIAFYIARYRYGTERVPNIVVMSGDEKDFVVKFLSYPMSKGMTQCLYWGNDLVEHMSEGNKKYYLKHPDEFLISIFHFRNVNAREIEAIIKGQGGKMPMDLFYLDENSNAHTYEIKAGGNLDTKNKVENKKEVFRLEKVFSMMGNNESKFATCYNNRGEGNAPDGAIFGLLDNQHKVIGKLFWEEILPEELTYEDFISIYSNSFNTAKVREIIEKGY